MKAHVRMRKWGNGLLAWGKLYQGDCPPLTGDEPLKEKKFPDGADKYGRLLEFPSAEFPIENVSIRKFRRDVFEIMQGVAELKARAQLIEAGPIVVRQPDALIRLDYIVFDVLNPSNGKWSRQESAYDYITDKWVEMTHLVKDRLPDWMDDGS